MESYNIHYINQSVHYFAQNKRRGLWPDIWLGLTGYGHGKILVATIYGHRARILSTPKWCKQASEKLKKKKTYSNLFSLGREWNLIRKIIFWFRDCQR